MLIMVPMRQTLRGVCFENTGPETEQFYMWAFLMPLYIPFEYISLNFGKRLGGGSHTWVTDRPNLISDIIKAIRYEALPFLGSPSCNEKEIVRYILKLTSRLSNQNALEVAAYTLIRIGEYEDALKKIDDLLLTLDREVEWEQKIENRALFIKTELLNSPANAMKQMAVWTEQTLHNLDLISLVQ